MSADIIFVPSGLISLMFVLCSIRFLVFFVFDILFIQQCRFCFFLLATILIFLQIL